MHALFSWLRISSFAETVWYSIFPHSWINSFFYNVFQHATVTPMDLYVSHVIRLLDSVNVELHLKARPVTDAGKTSITFLFVKVLFESSIFIFEWYCVSLLEKNYQNDNWCLLFRCTILRLKGLIDTLYEITFINFVLETWSLLEFLLTDSQYFVTILMHIYSLEHMLGISVISHMCFLNYSVILQNTFLIVLASRIHILL